MTVRIGMLTLAMATLAISALAAPPDPATVAREVDRLIAGELFAESPELAPRVDDATYLRRVWLDTVGDIPSPEHLTAFLLDPASDKRERVVRDLLTSKQFGQNWARYWRDVVFTRRLEDRALVASSAMVTMLTEELNGGTSWDAIAEKFITSQGDVRENGAAAIYMAQDGRTEEATAEMARIFLGVQIQCAQCHDHPYDRWKREQFHELAAFFPRIRLQAVNTPTRRSFAVVASDRPEQRGRNNPNQNRRGRAEHYMPDLDNPAAPGTRMEPRFFLTGAELPLGTVDAKRRGTIAEWMTGSEWFATAYVNRMWAELVGEGFYEPVDDLGPDRVPSAPQAVGYLSRQFAQSGHDPKWLLEVICRTEAYQRESRPRRDPGGVPFTANVAQRLRGDQLFNALLTTLELDEDSMRGLVQGGGGRGGYGGGASSRAAFEVVFGYDPSEPRATVTASIPQVLAMMNTRQLNQAISVGRRLRPTSLGRLVREIKNDDELTTELYLRTLCREPSEAELAHIAAYAESVGNRNEVYEDLLWSLINSSEYVHRK